MNDKLKAAAEAVLREAEPSRPEVAGGDERATGANVGDSGAMPLFKDEEVERLKAELAQEKAEYDNVSQQLDRAREELRAERRRSDALLASLEATVPKGQTWTPELQAGRLENERDAARAEVEHWKRRHEMTDASYMASCSNAQSYRADLEFARERAEKALRETMTDWGERYRAELQRAEGLAAALRKIQNYTDETITCGWAREALENHKSAREMAMTVVNQAWVDMAALSERAEKAEAELALMSLALDTAVAAEKQLIRERDEARDEVVRLNVLQIERAHRFFEANAEAERLAVALHKVVDCFERGVAGTTIEQYAREALEKFGGDKQ